MHGLDDSDADMDEDDAHNNDSDINFMEHGYESQANEALLSEHLSDNDGKDVQWGQDIDEYLGEVEVEDDYGYHEQYDWLDEENIDHKIDLDTDDEVDKGQEGYGPDPGWEPPPPLPRAASPAP
ncbi:hypothetical protein EW146_g9194 [Bondarzewia mesenterica]|uniref:Uncharacterized protein n=1 Tax=Bondarzewia mesenterica TaxID=1095465 RepID=A0A4V3XD02_9AGAM|nr:hypothetical protein EW146_g9194 [Bondarzewia mesenterica]